MNDKEEMVEDRHYLLETDPKTGRRHIVCKRTYRPKSKNPYTPFKDKETMEIAKEAGWPEVSIMEVFAYMRKLMDEAGIPEKPDGLDKLKQIRQEAKDSK